MKPSIKIANPPETGGPPKPTPLEALGRLIRAVNTLSEEMKALPGDANQYGTLQVMLSAARACQTAIEVLISSEEGS